MALINQMYRRLDESLSMSLYALDRDQGGSVFRQIARSLEADIKARYRPGDALPAEPVLAERFGVNRHTVRRAVDVLIEAGLLERRHGRGTFVLGLIDYAISTRTRFTEQLESQGLSADTEVIRRLIVPAANGVARRLNLAEGEDVVFIETRRRADGQPFCLVFFARQGLRRAAGSLCGRLAARLSDGASRPASAPGGEPGDRHPAAGRRRPAAFDAAQHARAAREEPERVRRHRRAGGIRTHPIPRRPRAAVGRGVAPLCLSPTETLS